MAKYSPAFWTANTAELLERMAYYAVFIVITLYLSNTLGFSDIEASIISGLFSGGLYLLPMFTGAFADKIGYRKSILIAFSLLSTGYLLQGLLPIMLESLGLVQYGMETVFTGLIESHERYLIIPILIILMIGGAFIKSIISASVARETTSETRAKGYSIFYMMVNIGSFTGKSVVDPLRTVVGDSAYIYINFFSAILCVIAFIAVVLFYHSSHRNGEGKSIKDVFEGLVKVFSNGRLLILILIVTGFWIVQQQLYATMPKYVIRLASETARPGWIANVNPFIVVVCVNFVTQIMAKRKALTSIIVGMFLIPLSALVMAMGNLFHNDILGLHPITFMMISGIVIQALAECFISPRYLEYFSLQAPKGEEGLYLGFSHLHSFLSSILGFGLSGILLSKYCPDPKLFPSITEWEIATVNAHYIWYWFAAIGMISAFALIIYSKFNKTKHINTN